MEKQKWARWWNNFVRSVAVIAVFMAVLIVGWIVIKATDKQGLSLSRSYEQTSVEGVGSVANDRRLVRFVRRDEQIICAEGTSQKQLIIHSTGEKSGAVDTVLPGTLSSVTYLREASWQLCNAYANGVITKEQYAAALGSLIKDQSTTKPQVQPAAKPKRHRSRSRHTIRHHRTRYNPTAPKPPLSAPAYSPPRTAR